LVEIRLPAGCKDDTANWRMQMGRKTAALFLGLAALFVSLAALLAVPQLASATSILVGQCLVAAPCTSDGGAPWSDTLSSADLASLGLGTSQPLIAAQTAQFVIRLGVTTMAFTTSGGPVTESLPEFSGGFHINPCNFCEIDTVGTFSIPADATSAVISGHFGNSVISNSSPENVCLGSGPGACSVTTVPEPGSLGLVISTLVGLGVVMRRRNENEGSWGRRNLSL